MNNVVELRVRKALTEYGDDHIPPGEYTAAFLGYETWARCRGWRPRVVMVWGVVDDKVPDGIVIPGYYPVLSISGKPKVNGRFRIGTKSKLYRDLGRMMLTHPPVDHIPVEQLDHRPYRISVRDVEKDQYQHHLGAVKYSVIDYVIGPE